MNTVLLLWSRKSVRHKSISPALHRSEMLCSCMVNPYPGGPRIWDCSRVSLCPLCHVLILSTSLASILPKVQWPEHWLTPTVKIAFLPSILLQERRGWAGLLLARQAQQWFYAALICKSPRVKMVCFKLGNETFLSDRNGPSLLPILILFLTDDGAACPHGCLLLNFI